MGSAVSSVFGGGGAGGILGAVGGIVGGVFGGPIGSMIGQAVGNLLNQAIGQAFNQVVDNLVSNHGMPKFLGDEVKAKVGDTLGRLQHQVPDAATNAAKDHFGSAIQEFQHNFANDLTAAILKALGKKASGADGSDGSGGAPAGKGWLQAIARAMGEHLGDKAAEMVSLSEQMTALDKESAGTTKAVADAGAKLDQGGKGGALAGAQSQDQANARKFNQLMTQFQATSQEYGMLNNTYSSAIKALGEALSSMARKQ
ncbi:hypothetical protein RQP53_16780 [Paucibacter sp. APW11]|uniref:Uncharacterized protein n=1 Tax=Roseateles aquae TaxID=3077235 RepID=A0ABU3PED5_9BURK|nr:hypothetical protein [Paucibacter sp. APW11]MDT9000934.1 hypothetical protein [Paucibacter sp. APW11]